MNYITTTDLRTKTSTLVELLLAGKNVNLVHRSKILGIINPKQESTIKTFRLHDLRNDLKGLDLEILSYKEREKRYREHLENKYVKGVS